MLLFIGCHGQQFLDVIEWHRCSDVHGLLLTREEVEEIVAEAMVYAIDAQTDGTGKGIGLQGDVYASLGRAYKCSDVGVGIAHLFLLLLIFLYHLHKHMLRNRLFQLHRLFFCLI